MSDITLVWEEKLNQLPFVFIFCYIVGKKTFNDISVLGLTFFFKMGILSLTIVKHVKITARSPNFQILIGLVHFKYNGLQFGSNPGSINGGLVAIL